LPCPFPASPLWSSLGISQSSPFEPHAGLACHLPLAYRGAGAAKVNRPCSTHHCRIPDQSRHLSRRSFYRLGDAQSFKPQIELAVFGTDPDHSTPSPVAPRSRNGGPEFRDVLHILGSNARDFRSGRP